MRALREARAITRDGWAARVEVSRATVQRWESGEGVPDAAAEAAIVRLCADLGLFRRYDSGRLAGETITAESLARMLVEARLAHRPGPDPTPPPLPRVSPRPRTSLPVPAARLIDREQDLAEVTALLRRADVRLVSITGPGGCGKTRLALEAAHRLAAEFADGAHFVDLSPTREPAHVASTIARALGLSERGEQPVIETVKGFLSGRQILLVLDNCEQIRAGEALVADLCATDWGVKVLVTSRSPLLVRAERLIDIRPLVVPEREYRPAGALPGDVPAVALFVERAAALNRDFSLSADNAGAVTAICRRLDGLPLALELAASLTRTMGVDEIAGRLEHPLDLLVGGPVDLPERHTALRNTVAWSYDLLPPGEQTLFRRLSIFAGGWTSDAAHQVAAENGGREEETRTRLRLLMDTGLVQADRRGGATGRWSMFQTVREFATELLEQADDRAALSLRHLRFYRGLARAAGQGLMTGAQPGEWVDRLDQEIDNLRGALDFALGDEQALPLGLGMLSMLTPYWWRGRIREGREWFERALAASRGSASHQRAAVLGGAATIMLHVGGFKNSLPYIDENIALSRLLNLEESLAVALSMRAMAHAAQGEDAEALALIAEAEALAEKINTPRATTLTLTWCGIALVYMRRLDDARRVTEVMLRAAQEAGDSVGIATSIMRQGDIQHLEGDYDGARASYEHCLSLVRESGSDIAGRAVVLARMGRIRLTRGESAEALTLFRDGITQAIEGASLYQSLSPLSGIAQAFVATREYELATCMYGFLETLVSANGGPVIRI